MPAGLTGSGEYGELPALASEAFLSGAARRRGGGPAEERGSFREVALCSSDLAELGFDEASATQSQVLGASAFDNVGSVRTLALGMANSFFLGKGTELQA